MHYSISMVNRLVKVPKSKNFVDMYVLANIFRIINEDGCVLPMML